jgi:hypothetical protein
VHPLIAQFLDASTVRSTLEKADAGHSLNPQEMLFYRAAQGHPEHRALLSGGTKSPEAQRAALAISVFTALDDLRKDEVLGPKAVAGIHALTAAGASEDEAELQLAMVLFEEAFGYDTDPAHFDQSFVAESLGTLKTLARLDQPLVEEITESFVNQASRPERPLYQRVAEAVFEAAWSEGPALITAEAVDEALGVLREGGEKDVEPALKAVLALFKLLESKELLGPERVDRLTDAARRSAKGGDESDEDEQ